MSGTSPCTMGSAGAGMEGASDLGFCECVEKINNRLGSAYALDQEWIDIVDRRAAQRQEKLEMELNGYKIRHKALIQYTNPFISVDLNTIASAFKTSVAGLEKEHAALITENQIQARIDSHNKILYARHADQRNTTFQQVLQTVGRVKDRVDIVIPIATVSSVHAWLEKKNGQLLVTDLDSTNGTFINDKRIRLGAITSVPVGSFITFGDEHLAVFRFLQLKDPKEAPAKVVPEE